MKNSKRERALEYARGIIKPNDKYGNEAIYLDNFNDQIDDEYQSDYSYQYKQDNMNYDNLNDNSQYASEIDKIKAIFN